MISEGMPSFPVALPKARVSKALLSSSVDDSRGGDLLNCRLGDDGVS